jgi:hypothetical protein
VAWLQYVERRWTEGITRQPRGFVFQVSIKVKNIFETDFHARQTI